MLTNWFIAIYLLKLPIKRKIQKQNLHVVSRLDHHWLTGHINAYYYIA